jgi:aspartokinase
VLVGVMVNAERADIYTDVEYIHAVDPLIVPNAPARRYVSYTAAYEMARFGTKVIKTGAVQLGMEHRLPIRVRSTFSQDPGTLIGAEEDQWPLVGLPLVASAQVAVLRGQDLEAASRLSLERHVGLLRLVDASSGAVILCAPLGDTASMVDKELSASGITAPTWQRGYSLLSLIGKKAALAEMEAKARLALRRSAIDSPYREITDCRATLVVPEQQSTAALLAVYAELREYLDWSTSSGEGG